MSFPRYPKYKPSGVKWLGEVPEHWEVSRLGFLCEKIGSGKTPLGGSTTYAEAGVIFIRSQNVYDDGLRLDDIVFISADVDEDMASSRVHAGDILLNITGASIGRTCLVPHEIAGANVNQHVCILRLINAEYRGYIAMFLKSPVVKGQIDVIQTGAGREGLNYGQISRLAIFAPPLNEQKTIAAFLDRETAKIDGLIGQQQRLIELLKEKCQAIISHAVTRGLNPHAPLKPSGVEWLGDVPAQWKVIPLGRVTVSRCDGPFGSGLKSEHYTDTGVRVIRLQNIRHDGFNGADEAFIDPDYYERELNGHDVVGGDILIAGLGDDRNTVGRACVAPKGIEPAMVKADCFRYRLDTEQVLPEFAAITLSAGSAADAGVLSSGSTRSRIPLSVMATRKVALPPMSEQTEIAAFINAASLQFDTLTAEAEHAIELLQERRSALISAAVTGQIDVRS